VIPSSIVTFQRRFGGTYCFRLHSRTICQADKQKVERLYLLLFTVPLKMAPIYSFETSFKVYRTTCHHIQNWTKLRSLNPRTNYTDLSLSAKLKPTFVNRGCHVVSVTDPYSRNLGFLDRSSYFLFQVAPQLYSRG
jgi:hypothetical protein